MSGTIAVAHANEIALAASTTLTLLQVTAPTNQRIKIKRYGVSFDGIVSTDNPIQVKVYKQTGSWTGTANTPNRVSPGAETIQTSAKDTMTAEGTQGSLCDQIEVHPQSGSYIRDLGFGDEVVLSGGEMFGITVTSDAAPAGGVNALVFIEFEE